MSRTVTELGCASGKGISHVIQTVAVAFNGAHAAESVVVDVVAAEEQSQDAVPVGGLVR